MKKANIKKQNATKKKFYAVVLKSNKWLVNIIRMNSGRNIPEYSGYVVLAAFKEKPTIDDKKGLGITIERDGRLYSKDYQLIQISDFDYNIIQNLERRNNILGIEFPYNRIPKELLNTGDSILFASDKQLSNLI